MIKYSLKCKCGEVFESWFTNSTDYESLKRKKLISCISCNSTFVEKSIMSPNVSSKSNKNVKNNKLEKSIKKELLKFRKYIEKNCKNVGSNLPQEARNIHYDNKTSKGIYGKATPEETAELIEEGIDIATVPWIDKYEN